MLSQGLSNPSTSHIVPVIMGENEVAVNKAKQMQNAGFYVLPIRAPTVLQGSARVRISLHAALKDQELQQLINFFTK